MPLRRKLGAEITLDEVLDWIAAIALRMHQSRNLGDILKLTVTEVREILGSDRVIIYRFLPDGDGVVAEESVSPEWKQIQGQLIYDPCFNAEWVEKYRQGRIGVLEDIDARPLEPCYKDLLMRLQIRANVVVPILLRSEEINSISTVSDRIWGLLIVHQCSSPRQWSSVEIKLLQQAAIQLGIALVQIELHRNLQQQNRDFSERRAAPQERQQVEEKLRWKEALLHCMTDTSRLAFFVVDNRTDAILYFNHRFCEIWGIEHLESQMRSGKLNNNDIIPDCLQLIADIPAFTESCKLLQSEENRCTVEDEIAFVDGRTIRRFSSQIRDDRDRYFGRLYVFEDITVYKQAEQALQQQAERERMIYEIAQRIRESLDLDEILNTTVAEVRHFLQTDHAIVYRFNRDWSGVVVKESVAEGWQAILNMQITDTYFVERQGQSYPQSAIQVTSDIYAAGLSSCHIELLERLQVRAKLVVPILQGDRLWGLLVAHHCSGPREWHPLETELLQQLATQVAIAIQQSELHQQLQIANQKLENLALVDQLTQIANRRCFDRTFTLEWYRLMREQRPLSLLLCDIDYFKQYNDTYGHAAGDTCLKVVAQTFKQAVERSTDLVARYGGEEFAVILPYTDTDGAVRVAQKIYQAMQELCFPHIASAVSPYVTLSIGIATVIPSYDLNALDLIEAADRALYQAKVGGRNRWFTSSIFIV
ncbi:diguanylate cyclase [Planktothrix sp. FACHB-1355]|uniref:Diguanylate cyclase n=1 Tax=Aerosakkonema funiforme FACHB-1375 TaxID=2949571 RepID=A0A926ZEE2_9CYAN|nr:MULTISPECIES: diguanylate cyclase [Oscillatoriales]MBD2179690.1 diguanylate cyclase [Aerosakkonema funiforme FACHB-1375]MBD3561546.1 diguanylate cyclase [Planktothrix sp. FACHB-1355]